VAVGDDLWSAQQLTQSLLPLEIEPLQTIGREVIPAVRDS